MSQFEDTLKQVYFIYSFLTFPQCSEETGWGLELEDRTIEDEEKSKVI